jgi:hypothetical protein
MRQSFLSTRFRRVLATVFCAWGFTLDVRNLLLGRAVHGNWLFEFALHGVLLAILNVAFYAVLFLMIFSIVVETRGRERLIMIGWSIDMVLSPVKMLLPEWVSALRMISVFALALALAAATSLLLRPDLPGGNGNLAKPDSER